MEGFFVKALNFAGKLVPHTFVATFAEISGLELKNSIRASMYEPLMKMGLDHSIYKFFYDGFPDLFQGFGSTIAVWFLLKSILNNESTINTLTKGIMVAGIVGSELLSSQIYIPDIIIEGAGMFLALSLINKIKPDFSLQITPKN